jgi:hypothetical protein
LRFIVFHANINALVLSRNIEDYNDQINVNCSLIQILCSGNEKDADRGLDSLVADRFCGD